MCRATSMLTLSTRPTACSPESGYRTQYTVARTVAPFYCQQGKAMTEDWEIAVDGVNGGQR